MFLIILSPAKTLDFQKKLNCKEDTIPSFLNESQELIDVLLKMKKIEIKQLMNISEKLTDLNYDRYKNWNCNFTINNSRHAIGCFIGGVYKGLNVDGFSEEDLKYSQNHLRILSGLYGVLKPLDLMQPYRLEMGVKLKTKKGNNLYDFWGSKITRQINQDCLGTNNKFLLNLSSNEYFDSLKQRELSNKIITPKFLDEKNGNYKIISFFAKKARGSMASYVIKNKIKTIEGLKGFNSLGYKFNRERSSSDNIVFIR